MLCVRRCTLLRQALSTNDRPSHRGLCIPEVLGVSDVNEGNEEDNDVNDGNNVNAEVGEDMVRRWLVPSASPGEDPHREVVPRFCSAVPRSLGRSGVASPTMISMLPG